MSKVDDIFSDMEPTQAPAVPTAPQAVAPQATVPPAPPETQPQSQGGYWKPRLPETPKRFPSKKTVLFAIIGVIVVGLLGGGYIAYSKGVLKNPFAAKNTNSTSTTTIPSTNTTLTPCVYSDEYATMLALAGLDTSEEKMCFFVQLFTVEQLRNALDVYRNGISPISGIGAYPTTLAALVPELNRQRAACDEAERLRKEQQGATGLGYSCPTYISLLEGFSTTDVYTRQLYGYTTTDDDFALTFEIRYYTGISDDIKAHLKDGNNTVDANDTNNVLGTKDYIAPNGNINATGGINANSNANTNAPVLDTTTDYDYDGLTDYEEMYVYLTDKNLEDTDSDGFDDKTEVCGGYNPVGTGKSIVTFAAPASGCPQ